MQIETDWSKAQAIRPSVSAVILREGRLLLQQRADGGQLRFVWIFPTDTFGEITYHYDE